MRTVQLGQQKRVNLYSKVQRWWNGASPLDDLLALLLTEMLTWDGRYLRVFRECDQAEAVIECYMQIPPDAPAELVPHFRTEPRASGSWRLDRSDDPANDAAAAERYPVSDRHRWIEFVPFPAALIAPLCARIEKYTDASPLRSGACFEVRFHDARLAIRVEHCENDDLVLRRI